MAIASQTVPPRFVGRLGEGGDGTCRLVAFVHFEGMVCHPLSSHLALEPYLAYHAFEMHKRDLSTGATPPSPKRPTNRRCFIAKLTFDSGSHH